MKIGIGFYKQQNPVQNPCPVRNAFVPYQAAHWEVGEKYGKYGIFFNKNMGQIWDFLRFSDQNMGHIWEKMINMSIQTIIFYCHLKNRAFYDTDLQHK